VGPSRSTRDAARLERQRGGIVLGRSPFEPRVIALGIATGLALAFLGAAAGWPLTAATPIAAELEAVRGIEVGDARGLRAVATFLSHVGHLIPVAFVALLVAAFAKWRWGTWDLGLLLLVVLGGASSVTGTIKLLTTRARPHEALVETLSSSFPSGHAVRAAAVYGLIMWLALLITRRRALRFAVVVLAVVVITTNSLARVALAAHWPSDVMIGVALGSVWLAISLWLLQPHTLATARRQVDVRPSTEDAGNGQGTRSSGLSGR
jgi:membrane-associated phospholipid phosphatase